MATGVPFTALALQLLALALLAPLSSGVVVLPGSGSSLLPQICASAPTGAKLCWPLSPAHYVQCSGGKGKLVACPSDQLYDYGKRTCRPSSSAVPCPTFACPTSTRTFNLTLGKPPLSAPYGKFGKVGNYNVSFPKAGQYAIFCPVMGHCWSGMSIDILVYEGAKGPAYVEVNKFEEPMKNSDLYPKKYKAIQLPVGGVININWDEPIHFVDVYNVTDGLTLPNVPYPPQPTYKCPDWKVINNGTFIEILPGETRLVNFQFPPVQNYTWVANITGTRWFVCPLGTHCRMGQVFKVTIKPATVGYMPILHNVTWTLSGDNYPDMTINKGDTVYFNILGVHALSLVKSMKKYYY